MPWEKQFDSADALDKAMAAFWVRGYEAVSVQDLVDCTGVNRGSLYATFGDKRDLFVATLRHYDRTVRKALLAQMEHKFAPREAIRQVLRTFVQASLQDEPRGCFLTNTALELAAHDKEIGAVVAASQRDIEIFFARMIDRAKSAGEIAKRVDTASTAQGLLAVMLGLAVLSRSRPKPALLDSIITDAMRRLD